MEAVFLEVYGESPTHLSRAPGRVNLIGEHIDYNLLPVLPVALQREVRIALRPRDDGRVRLHNVDGSFASVDFEIVPGLERVPDGHWSNYVMAPADLLARRFAIYRGFDGVVTSDVPVASGLSSSSALVIAVGLALEQVNEVGLNPLTFAEYMAEAERFTGTEGGGMDQAVSVAGRLGCAAFIEFDPLRVRHAQVPLDWRFVVADTGVRAEKSGPAQAAYNARRVECHAALEQVGAVLVERDRLVAPPTSYPALLKAVDHADALAVGEEILAGNLRKRFRHVLTEGRRVVKARDALVNAQMSDFGIHMDASHGSLRSDFNVSSAELDELVALAKEGGAAGARLTGAGFGGCMVALASPETQHDVLRTLSEEYYEPRGMKGDLSNRLFTAVPSAGASFARLR